MNTTREKYNGYCFYCYINLFPDNEIVRNYKVKEKHFADFIEYYFPKTFTFDKIVSGGCSKRRPDVFLDLYTHVINGEIDDDSHKYRDTTCEEAKINDTFTDNADRPMVLIRINPDKYVDKNGEKVPSCFEIHRSTGVLKIGNKNELQSRMDKLKERLEYWMNPENIPTELMTIEYHYYDGY